jgi:MoaA/NifB/PqqE/SkfB family radical SAM enzyme
MFYGQEFPQTIHFEITDKCNASCPQCGRNKLGGVANPYLKNTELSLKQVQAILPEHFARKIKRLYMCGNYGDPIVATDTLEVFKYLRKANPEIWLGMNTNASAQSPDWWSELGKVFLNKGDIKFGIDGLEDTHAIYRRNTNYKKILENASAFINSGGHAHWEFIVFKHNEHQVEHARELSKRLGFKKFTVKKTGRFFSNTKMKINDHQEVHNKNGGIDYIIEKPTRAEFQNKSLQQENAIVKMYGSMDNYLNETQVSCKVIKENSLYISAEGLVFPCCWTANQLYLWYMPKEHGQIWNIIKKHGGKESLSSLHHPIPQIIAGDVFKEIKESWACSSLEAGKLKVCAKTCGNLFDQFKDQYK